MVSKDAKGAEKAVNQELLQPAKGLSSIGNNFYYSRFAGEKRGNRG